MIYLIVFFLSAVAAYFCEKNYHAGKKRTSITWGIVAILLPSLLAAFRMEGVGTDTLYYVKRNFHCAILSDTFQEFNHYFSLEFLYNALVFIVSRFTNNIHVLYFFIQGIIMFFVFRACYDERDNSPIWFSYLLFLLLYYNRSLNMIRQSLALAIVLYAFKYVKKKQLLKYIFFIFIASLFHKTALLAIIIYFLTRIIEGRKSFLFKLFILLFGFLFLVGYQEIMFMLINLGIVPNKFLFYVIGSESNLLLIELFRKILFIAIFILFGKSLKRNSKENGIFMYFMGLDIILYLVGLYANYAQRISYYLGYFDIFLISRLPNCCKNKVTRNQIYVLLILFFLAYWYIYYKYLGYDATFPYASVFN